MEPSEQSFKLFPTLPIELRLKIWEAYHEYTPPQFISLYLVNDSDYDISHENDCEYYPHMFLFARPIPTLLHINHEAREFGLKVYHAGFDVHQSLNTKGSWWKPEELEHGFALESYKPCLHETGVNVEETRSFCYWDPKKDVVVLTQSESPLSAITELAAWVWSGRCDIRFSNIRWLAFSDVVAKTWMASSATVSSNTIWRDMEAIFMIVPEIKEGRSGWIFKERIKKDKKQAYESGDSEIWIGRERSLVPQVCLIPAKRRSEIERLITKRINAGEKSYMGEFVLIL